MVNAGQTKIYTFYSYKGGVGRSMALANIAELLYQKGLSVLMVDFDLEAPGLEQYFYKASEPEGEQRLREIWTRRGVIDLLFSYKSLRSLHDSSLSTSLASGAGTTSKETPLVKITANRDDGSEPFPFPKEPLANFITEINAPTHTNPARLSLMTAGKRSKERINTETNEKEIIDDFPRYADRVRSFAWDDFYLNWDGERFFEWFRNEVINSADVVLIDSRTGVAEMSGVCTYQLADIAVMFVASNNQNVEGTKKIAESLTSQELIREGRKGRELSLVFVPSRVDLFEKVRLDDLAERFKRMTDTLISPSVTFKINAFDDLKIPYIPYYSFVEELAVRDKNSTAAIEMTKAYENICRSLAQLDPVVKEKLRSEGEISDKVNVAEQLNRSAENVFAQLSPTEQDTARSLFTRLLRVARIDEGEVRDTPRYARESELTSEQLEVAEKFIAQGLLSRVGDSIGLADERLLSSWVRIKDWVKKDREFLLWRQDLQGAMGLWERAGRQDSDLLLGSKYEEAQKWLNERISEFNELEFTYLKASAARRNRDSFVSRVRSAGALLIAVVAIFLAALSLWGRVGPTSNNAEARSLNLAGKSDALLPSKPTVSLALAIEATRAYATAEAQEALKKALLQSNMRTVIQVNANPNSARFSHDGKKIVTGSQNGEVTVWQRQDGDNWQNVRQWVAHYRDVTAAIFSPDDQLIATAGYDGRAVLWNPESGKMIAQLSPATEWGSRPASIADMSFSRNGRFLAAASTDNHVYVWEINSGRPLQKLGNFKDDVKTVDFSANSLIASDGNEVVIWSVNDWQPISRQTFDIYNPVLCARFSNDNSLVVTAHSNGTARVWSLPGWNIVSTFSEHKAAVTHASFSPDGKLVVTAGNETTAMIWEATTGKLSTSLRGALRTFTDTSFSPDGKLVLTAEVASLVRLWDRVDVNPNSSPNDLINQGCSRLLRNMTKSEWQQYVGAETYRATCSKLSFPVDDGAIQEY